jgi:hypothetical protein
MGLDPMSVISFRGYHALVPKQTRYRSNRDVMLEKPHCKGVSESVWVNIDTNFATDRIQSTPKTLDARFQGALRFAAPEEVLFIFNRHREQSVYRGFPKNKHHRLSGFQHPYQEPAGFQVQAPALEFRDIGDTEAGIKQQQHKCSCPRPVPFDVNEKVAGVKNRVNFSLLKRQSARQFVLHLLHRGRRILAYPVSVFAEITEAPQTLKFFSESLTARLSGQDRTITPPSVGSFQQGRAIWDMRFLRFARPARSKASHQVNRDLRRIEATFAVTEGDKCFKRLSITPNCRCFETSRFAVRKITCHGVFEQLPFALFRLPFGHEHSRKFPFGPCPIASLHRFANTLTVNVSVAPDRTFTFPGFASPLQLRTPWGVPPVQIDVCHGCQFYQNVGYVLGTTLDKYCKVLIIQYLFGAAGGI